MCEGIITEAEKLLNVYEDEGLLSEFVDIYEKVKEVNEDTMYYIDKSEYLNALFDKMYEKYHRGDDYYLFSSLLEKNCEFLDEVEFTKMIKGFNTVVESEQEDISSVFEKNDAYNRDYLYMWYDYTSVTTIRVISNKKNYILNQAIRLTEVSDVSVFTNRLMKVFDEIVFSNDIEDGIRKLNDGFLARRNEICYHVFCIYDEVPIILEQGITDYQSIGNAMSISCSPERKRKVKQDKLVAKVEGMDINCELHTKMKKISTKAPDRIYFCPCLSEKLSEKLKGRIYIHAITEHV